MYSHDDGPCSNLLARYGCGGGRSEIQEECDYNIIIIVWCSQRRDAVAVAANRPSKPANVSWSCTHTLFASIVIILPLLDNFFPLKICCTDYRIKTLMVFGKLQAKHHHEEMD